MDIDNLIYRQEFRVNEGRVVDVPLTAEEVERIQADTRAQQAKHDTQHMQWIELERLKNMAVSVRSVLDAPTPVSLEEAGQQLDDLKTLVKWLIKERENRT